MNLNEPKQICINHINDLIIQSFFYHQNLIIKKFNQNQNEIKSNIITYNSECNDRIYYYLSNLIEKEIFERCNNNEIEQINLFLSNKKFQLSLFISKKLFYRTEDNKNSEYNTDLVIEILEFINNLISYIDEMSDDFARNKIKIYLSNNNIIYLIKIIVSAVYTLIIDNNLFIIKFIETIFNFKTLNIKDIQSSNLQIINKTRSISLFK
jgi:hypothetical protein